MNNATTQLNGPALSPVTGLSQATGTSVTPASTGADQPSFAQLLEENSEPEAGQVKTGTEPADKPLSGDPQPTEPGLAEQNSVPPVPQLTSDFILAALVSNNINTSDLVKTNVENTPSLPLTSNIEEPEPSAIVQPGTGKPETQTAALDKSATGLASSIAPVPSSGPVQILAEETKPFLAADLRQKAAENPSIANNLATSQGLSPEPSLTPANENRQNNSASIIDTKQPFATSLFEPVLQDNSVTAESNGVSKTAPNLTEARQNATALATEPVKATPDTAAFALANGPVDKALAENSGLKPRAAEGVDPTPTLNNTLNGIPQQDTPGGERNPSGRGGENAPALMETLKPVQDASLRFAPLDNFAPDTGNISAVGTPATTALSSAPTITIPAATSPLNQPLPQVPLDNMAVHIAAQARAGHQQFNIRLDPPELGRIDIKLEIGADGSPLTHLAVEKPETLDLLRQDSRALERALANAGFDSRTGSLSFSLKEDNQNGQQPDNKNEEGQPQSSNPSREEIEDSAPIREQTLNVSSGLDISI